MLRRLLLILSYVLSVMAQVQLAPPSVAAVDDPQSVLYNPAGLAFNDHSETMLMIYYDGQSFTRDFSYLSQAKTGGFGYQWDVVSATNIWRFSQAMKLTESQALGLTYAIDDSRWRAGRLDLGWMHRPYPFLALGANLKNIWSGNDEQLQVNAGVAFQNREGKWGGGFDMGILRDDSGPETEYVQTPSISAFIEPLQGFRLSSWMELGDDKASGISISLFVPDAGVESHALSSNSNAQTMVLRSTLNPYRSIFGTPALKKGQKTYIRMKLDGLYIEEPELKKPNLPFNFDIEIPLIRQAPVYGKQLKKFIDEIDGYTRDPNVHGLIIDLGTVRAGFSKLSEMRKALQRFHDADKEIIVYSKFGLSNGSTYLLSMADEIYCHEMAGVDLRGLGMEVTFFRGLLDTLSIVPEVWRVSPYKTASDTYLNETMSEAMRENYSQLLDGIYDEFVRGISQGKLWEETHTREIIDGGPYMLTRSAIEVGLLTDVMYPDEFDTYVSKLNKGKVRIIKSGKKEAADAYRYAWRDDKIHDRIAVIYAVGGIVSGKTRPGPSGSVNMGDETIAAAIRQARQDKSIKAIVLRIDSGGGSALASDIMWREILKTTSKDSSDSKPVIASMSDMAASGGYYIACQADSIIAYPSTITGSIGVIGMRLNFSQLQERFGLHTESILRGKRANFASGNRLATDEESRMIQASIDHSYQMFKERVIAGREKLSDVTALDSIALGRVWTGQDARGHGLVDELGGYYDAIELAKEAAGIAGEVEIVELPDYKIKTDLKKLMRNRTSVTEEILASFGVNDLIQVLDGDQVQMILPVKIEIK